LDKRYQVFINSTFLDLKEERQAVSQALLRLDGLPILPQSKWVKS
jgi:hypothetical protein